MLRASSWYRKELVKTFEVDTVVSVIKKMISIESKNLSK